MPLLPMSAGKISPLLTSRDTINSVLEATRAFEGGRRGFLGQGAITELLRSSTVSRIQYVGDVTESLDAFSVLAYGAAQIDIGSDEDRPDGQRNQVFTGETPSDESDPFVITVEPAAGGGVVRCVVAGLAVVQINVTSASHKRAKPIAGDTTKLVSCNRGGVPIVSRESGTGVKWSVILLGFGSSGSAASVGECARSWLRLPDCATLTTTEQEGACGCVPSQSAALTKQTDGTLTSETYLYGCPPGVTTTVCPSGNARKFNVTLSGLTGGSAVLNGGWTFTYSATVAGSPDYDYYLATKGGLSAWLKVFAGGGARMIFDEAGIALDYTADTGGCCATFTFSLNDAGSATDYPAYPTAIPATSCGKGPAYTPVLSRTVSDCGICIKLKWVPVAGSGARSIEFHLVECGTDASGNSYIDFATDDPLLCTGGETECGANSFVCRVTCNCCEFTTPGWYCTGSGCEYVTTCRDGLLAGPFDTEGECSCSVALACCGGVSVPLMLCLTFSADTYGPYGPLDGVTVVLRNYQDAPGGPPSWAEPYGNGSWVGRIMSGYYSAAQCGGLPWRVVAIPCSGGDKWTVAIVEPTAGGTVGFATATTSAPTCAPPFSVVLNWNTISYPPCYTGVVGGTVTASIAVNADCADDPPPPTYVCVDGSCVEVFDGSGQSLTDCLAGCTGAGGGGSGPGSNCGTGSGMPNATMVITGGPHAGSYSLPWHSGSPDYLYNGSGEPIVIEFFGGAWHMVSTYSGVQDEIATGGSCGPPMTSLTFAGSTIGATGVTVTIPHY